MKRGYIARKPKRRRVKATGKRLGTMLVSKGPARDKEHLAKVRGVACLDYGRACSPTVEAHHVRCIGPRTLGVRVSDYLSVPLCTWHHHYLHSMNEGLFWIAAKIDPAEWIARFSPEGAAEIARLNGAKSAASDVNEDHHA